MLFRKFNRRGFFHVCAGLVGLVIAKGLRCASAQLARLEMDKAVSNGATFSRITIWYAPKETVWGIKFSPNLATTNSWTSVTNAANIVRGQKGLLNFIKFDVPVSGTNALFVKAVLTTNASMKLALNSFPVPAGGETLFTTMTKLSISFPSFTFKSRKHSELGEFIWKIGEIEDGDSHSHWTLYVNGKEAILGSSTYIPQMGDEIEWKFEKRS